MKIVECTSKEEGEIVLKGINAYNDSQTDRIHEKVHESIRLVAKNEANEIIGGVFGYIGYYAGFKIDILWMREDTRGLGLGTKLLQEAENKAKELGATIAILDTFSFQAEDFYLKNGYEEFGRISGYPKENQEFIFLKKDLK